MSPYAGARVGEPGFGFAVSETGPVASPGGVVIGDGVKLASTALSIGAAPIPLLAGTRIDNLVQIGHNVEVAGCA